ncbi:MAG: hypothetical protein ACXABY_05970 [Candidatus Thorarchaeota archaeon]|jgi:hypothetical protein
MDICVVASMKFKDKVTEISQRLEKTGIAHSLPVMDLEKEDETPDMVPDLVYGHFKKIDQCQTLLVVNPDGYIGNSVKIEIGYAKGAGKKIVFLKRTGLPEIDCLADSFIGEDELEKLRS